VLQHPRDAERPRRVLLLTDGQVSNEQDVIDLASKHADHARVFTFGIGAGASEHLVRGVARASRAAVEMIFPGERIEPKVLRMFDRVRTPALDDVRVDWHGLQVEQAPGRTPPVFAGDHLVVLGRIEGGAATDVALHAGDRSWSIAIDLERATAGGPIPILWARERIRELDDERETRRGSQQRRPESDDARRRKLIELGTRYGLLSSVTSYVAVEERAPSERTDRPAELRRIPVALTTGWGGVGLRGGVGHGGQHVNMTFGGRPSPRTGARGMAYPAPAAAMAPPPMRAGGPPPPMRPAAAPLSSSRRGLHAPPAPQAGPAKGAGAVDPLFEVLMTQRADGSFPRSREVAGWLGADRTRRLDEAIAAAGEAVVVTAVVVALLERDHRDREAEWRPAVAKAKQWLAAQGATFDPAPILG
jgi:Ca-activated chloride channel family protein